MPTIQNSSRGHVVQIWGKAYIRGTDGVWRPLSVGEVVAPGAEILTEQNAIVMMTRAETALPKVSDSTVDRAISAVENDEEPPAAGLFGGGSGDLQPGLRVDRIVELVTPASIDTRLETTAFEFGIATQSDPDASAFDAARVIAASSSIAAVEAGGSVNLGLRAPSGAGTVGATLTITVTTVPAIGQVFTADGTAVVAGTVLGVDQLAGLTYVPPADYMAGTDVGRFGYQVSNGIDSADGNTRIAVTPVNDAPLAIDGGRTGSEDVLIDVPLSGIDIDGTVARIAVVTPPANGMLLLGDTLAPVAAGQALTPAQAANLVFRPAANWSGSTAFTFSVTDNDGSVSAPATMTLDVTAVNDAPLAVNDSSSTVAQIPVTVAVLGNDSDVDNDALTVSSASVPAALGSVVVNGDGSLTFTAAPGVTGAVAVSYTIADPSGATSSATLTINVAALPAVTVDVPALTNDSTPTLTGTSNLPAGSTVTLTVTGFNGAVQIFTTPVRADGTYSVDVPAALAEGPYAALASVNGPGGTSATANDNGVVDITPPLITVDAPALTNDSTPALTGTTDLPAGSTITLTVTGANGVAQLFTTAVQAGGVFNVDVPAALVSGPFTASASGTDAAGNSATASDNGVVDTLAPAITVDAPALTNDTTPTLNGATDLPAGSTVSLAVTGANGAVQTFTTTVQAGGVYSVDVPAALVEGNFSVTASGTDAAGNSATASDSGVIDSTPPTVSVDAPALTNDTTPPLTGTTNLPAGATVTLTVTGADGAVQTFSTVVQSGGAFSVDVPAALVQGTFSVSATATDAAGNSASATDTGLIDTTPPVASMTIDPVTADNIVNAGEAGGNITITGGVGGDVQVGDTVTLAVNGVNYSGVVLAGNTYAISVPGAGVLADADRRIDGSVTTTDAAGNSTTATAQRTYAVNSAPIAVDDTLSVGEDSASAGSDVTPGTPAQDRDADGDTLTVIGVVTGVQPSASGNVNTPLAGTWGTLLLDGLGAYTYAPSAAAQALDAGQTVSDTFTYTVEDGRGGSATATLTISVVGADDPTTISGVFVGTVTEDAVATAGGTLTNNDPDVGTRAFVVQNNSAGTYGTFSIDSAGVWNYTLTNAAANVQALAQGQSVTETFIVATDDGTTASITVTVSGANDAPVVSSTSINAVEEGAAVGLGLTVPSDIDNGSVLAITVTGLPMIGQVQLADGTPVANGASLSAAQLAGLRFLPPADYSGEPVGTFAYSVSDGIATVNGGTTINVAAVNDRPVAIDSSATGFEDTTTRIAVTPAGSDVDGSVVSYTLATVPANGLLYSAASGGTPLAAGAVVTGPVHFQPNANFNGTVTFDYTATDNGGGVSANTATATIVVSPVNDAPTLAGVVATFNYSEGSTPTVVRSVIDGSVVLADIDSPDFGGGSVTVAIANVVAAEDLLGIRNQGGADGQISVAGSNVSYNPVGAAGSVVIGTISGGTGSAPLVVSLNSNASVTAVDALLQNITYGNASQQPTTTPRNLTITVVDGDGTANGGADTVSTNVTVNITRVNDAPLFTALNGGVVNTTEGAAPALLDSNATVNDPELGSGYVGAINNMGGAVLTLSRIGGANAQDVFSASGGTLALTGGNVVLGGNTVGSYNVGALANGTLQITFASGATQAEATNVLRQIRYVNTSDAPPASVAIGYTINDGNTGSQGTGGARTGTATVTVNIAAVNDPPVAANDSETTSENTPLAASVPPATDADGTIAGYALVSGPGAGNGALVFNSDGTFNFNPGSDFDALSVGATRNVSFTYTATDNSGAVSNVATVTITVTGTNDGPLAFNATLSTGENSTLNASVPAGSDVDGTISSYALVGNVGANNGALAFNADGSYSFATGSDFDNLAAGQSRDVSFTYTATDNDGATSAPATVTITVTGANDAPTGADATYTIAEDGSRAFAGADFGFADIDVGDTLAAVRIDSPPAAGTLTLSGTPVTAAQVIAAADLGNLVFTPLADASGAPYAAFTFSVQDNGGLFDAAPNTITLNVTPVNDPPVAVVAPASGDEDTPIAVSLAGTDIDGTVTAVTVTVLPANGTLFLADGITPVVANTPLSVVAAASLVFRPAADFNGTVNLTFTVTDNNGAVSAPAVLPITVMPVVDPAILIGDVTVNESAGTATFTVILDQSTTATVSVNFATGNGTASAGADYSAASGTLTFAPGTTTRTVTVAIADDGVFEGNEGFNVVLSGAVNATIADGTAVATITDNDTPALSVSSPTVTEGGFAVFTVSLSNPSTTAVTFNPTLSSGTATVGTDTATALEVFDGASWVAVPVGGVTIAAGTTSVQVRVATSDEVAAEGDETFDLTATVTAGTTSNASASGTATVSDDIDATTVTLTATPSVAEGGSIVYTATLASAAVTPMAVTLSTGQTINIAAGASSGSTTIGAPSDDVHVDAGSVSRTIASTTGGGFEAVAIDPAAATTAVTDTVDTTTVSITGDAVVAEGATASYTVSLTSAAQTAVTVSLTYSGVAADGSDFSGVATVTIPDGSSSANFSLATLQDSLAEGAESFTVTLSSAAGGNFENLVISGANGAQTTSISDDDTPTLAVSSPTVGEGGFAVFTVSLSNASTTAVTFNPTLSSGTATVGADTATALEYFNGSAWLAVPVGGVTIAAGSTSVQVRVATNDDVAAEGSETFALTASVTAGATVNASATGTATITDDADATTVSLTATPSVAEGGSIVYTATLSNAAVTAMTVTLSNGAAIAIAAGATSGSTPLAAPSDDVYLDAGSVSATIASTSGGGFEALAISPAPATTSITDTIDTTTAILTATPSVAEGGTITYTVSLTSPVAGSPVIVTLANGQTVNIAVGASSGGVSTAVADNVFAGGGSVANSIVSATGGNFESLSSDTAPVTTTVTDDGDITTVSLSATASVIEGGSIAYTATLTNPAQTPVTVTLSNGAVITIAAGDTSGSTPVAAPGDDPHLDASTVSATIVTATGGNFESLQIDPAPASTSVTDDVDATTVSLSATPSVAEGGSIVYTATLTNAAQTPVTVTLSSGETIAIAAGANSGSVTILAPTDDVYADAGTVSRTISSATGGNFESLTVDTTAADTTVTDTIDSTTVSITGDATAAEGATASYTVSLTSAAQTAVTVSLGYSGVAADGTDFSGVAAVTIPAGSSSANFSVATLQDALAEGAESFTVTIGSAAGGNFESLVISGANGAQTTSITDDDTPTLSVSSPTLGEGGFAVFTVLLSNPSTTAVTFDPALSSGTATVGTDSGTSLEYFDGSGWIAVPVGSVTIAAGSTSVQVRVATIDDFAAEGDESFTLTATITSGNTANASATGTATITDDSDATTVTLTATPSVAEGGSIIYTATLTNPAVTAMTVALSNGAAIAIAAGATSGSTPLAAPSDDVYLDAGSVSATIASTSGGGFEAVTISPAPATTSITDTIDTTTAILTATPSVAEGGAITYTVSLAAPVTGSAVIVTLANGQTISIAVGASSGSITTAVADNVHAGGGSVTNSIASVSGGNFEQLSPDTAPVTTTVTDDGDVTTISLSATASVVEGGSIVYTATLTNPAQTPVTVTLSNGAVIAIAAGDSSGSTPVAAPGDDPYLDASTVNATISTATGGNFEALQIDPAAASTSITDDVDATTVSLSASASVAEGGSIVYTATLTNAAQTPVTVTLSTGETIAIATGATTGSVSVLAPTDDVYIDAGSVSRTISAATGGNFESLTVDAGPATTTVTDTIDTTTATLTATPSVVEGGTVTYTVSLAAPVTGSDIIVTLAGGQTITIAVGASSGTATGSAPDNVYAGGSSVSNNIVSATGGSFESLSPNTAPVTTTVTDDADASTISLAATPNVAEGGSIVYTATLTHAAVTAMSVTLSSGQTINIAAGATTGSVSVAAPADDPYVDAGSVSRSIASTSGGGFESLSIDASAATTSVSDTTDVTTATLTATSSVAEGGTITYTVSLAAPVTGTVVNVLLANGQTVIIPVGASSASVDAIAPDNVHSGGASVANNIVSASGGNYEQLTPNTAPVTTSVSDDGDVTTVSLSATASVVEGTSITYSATLSNAAQTPVTVTLSNGATISIAAGATSGTAVVAAPGDDPYVDAGIVSATIATATGGNFESLQIDPAAASTTVTDDNDPTTLDLSATASVAEGGSIVYTATLSNAAQTPLTVTLSGGATITIAAGATSGSVAVAAPSDDVYVDAGSVTRGVTATSGGNFESLQLGTVSATTTVTDTIDATAVSITGSSTVAEGATASYTVSLTSPAQTAVTVDLTYSGTAADGSDYNGVASVTIPAGASSASFNIATLQDVIGEGAENFTVTIASAAGGNFESLVISGANGAQTTQITDDDTPTIAVSSPTVGEGGFAVFTVSLSNASTTAVTFNPTLSSGTATVGADTATALEYFNGTAWVAVPVGGVTLAAGSTSVQVRVATSDDVAAEGNETFALTATVTAGTTGNTSAVGTATITDDVDGTTLTLTATPSVAEGGTIVYTATLSNPAVTALTVTLSTGQTIGIAAGATTGTVSIAAPGEDPYVDASTVSRTISSTSGGGFEALTVDPAAASTAVTDTIDTTTLSISGPTSVAEGAAGTYTVSLTSPAQTAVTVNLAYAGTAANGADYGGVATVTIAAGASSATFNIATVDDLIDEVAAESFTVTVASASGGNFENLVGSGSNNSVTTAITDNDAAPTIAVSSPTVAEAGGFALFTVSQSNPSSTATTVSLALANGTATGADYGPALEVSTDGGATWTAATSATFAAGATSVLVRTPITSDALDETDEAFTLTATRTAGTTANASATGTATISDDDATPSLAIDDVTVNESAGTATFTVTLSAASGQSVSVNVATSNGSATAGADYTAVPGTTLTFAPGVLTQTITVPIMDDGTYEGVESFNVLLSGAFNATIADTSGLGTINDNDLPALSVSSPTVGEGGFAVFTVALSNPSTTAVTFNPALASGTATVGTDTGTALEYFNGSAWAAVPVGGVTIAAGSTSVQVRVATTDDVAAEGSETFTLTATVTAGTTSNASAVGTATISDDSDATTVSLTATPSVVEGGSITYTASLTSAAVTPMTVNLSGGGVISIAAGATTGTISIAAPGDDPYIDAGIVSRSIATTSGGGFEALTIDATAAVTSVSDDSDATTVTLTATPSVAEGGAIIYTATLTNAAQTAVTVTLSSGQTIGIAAGATSGTASIAAPSDDPYIDAGSVSRTIASASGGNFESLVINPAAATTSVTDTIDVTTATLTATPSVAEGGTITYTVSLTAPVTGSAVTVTLAGGQTITIPIGASSGTASATAPDNAYAGGGSVANNIASIGGGNFEQLTPNTAPVTTNVTDDADVTTVTLTATPSVVEGGNITYTATLTNAALTAVTVNLAGGGVITIVAGATTGTVSIGAPGDDPYIDAGNVSRTISSATGGGFESLLVNPAAAVTSVSDDSDATTVTLTATPSVVEGGNIVYTATLTNAAQTAVTVTLSSGETIAIAAGATTGTVSIAAPSDDVYIDASTVSRTISTATGGNFELLTISPAAATTTVTDDGDATTVTLTATPSVAEGGTIVYTATLSSAAQSAVTVTLSSGQTISIASGATSGTVSIAAPSDDVYIDAGTVSRTITGATGGNFEALTVDPAAATTSVTDTINTTTLSIGGSATVAEGGSGSYTVSLTSLAQTTAVSVNLTYAGTAANGADFTGVATVTIPVGSSSATFNIATIDDLLDEGAAESFTITLASASGGNFENLAISGANGSVTTSITDNDPPPALSINDVTVNEGAATMTFTVTLSAASGQSVSVSYGTSNGTAVAGGDYTAAGGTLTFAPGVTSQTITVPITNDLVYEIAETLYVNLSAPSNATLADSLGVGVIVDNDPAPTVATVSAAATAEGGDLVHTVTLSNPSSTTTALTYALAGGSATAGADYNATPTFSNGVTLVGGVLTVPAGVSSFTVTVASVADAIDEANETYDLSVGGVVAVGTINDDDNAPAITVGNLTVNETAGFAVFSVGLSNPSSAAVSVSLALANGTATGGTGGTGSATDYGNNTRMEVSTDGGVNWSAPGTNAATIAAGQTNVLVRTTIINNTGGTEVASETFTLTATRTAGTTSNPTAIGTATIIEQDIAISSATIAEGTGAGTTTGVLTVTVNPAFAVATSLPFTLTGAALSPADYGTLTFSNGVTVTGGNINIPAGVTSFTVSVPVVRDALDESNETVVVNIAGSNGTLTINDDDATPTLAINDVTVNEGAGTATFTVTLSAASGQTVTVNYGMVNQTALSGVDFTASAGTLTFTPGTTTQTITVPILQDNIYEGTETFRINLSGPVNATLLDGAAIGTIADNGTGSGGTDNDTPTLAVSSITVSDQSSGFATFVVSLSNPSASATSVNLALTNGTATGGGVDYGAAGATNLQVSTNNGVTWVNATSATIPINGTYVLVRTPITADVANEVSETFTLTATRTAGTTTNASASGIGTITDIYNGPDAVNDAPASVLQEDTPAATVLAGNAILGGSGDAADTDPNNDSLAITGAVAGTGPLTSAVALAGPITVSGLYGNLVIQANGSYTYTLDNTRIQTQNMIGGQAYSDVFTYRITDGNGGYDNASITVSVTGTLDLTAITPQPVAIAADGLQGEYYGYNDTSVAGNRVHADDGTATSLGTGSNLESVEDITAIINGRNVTMGGPGNIVGTNLAGATNAADVIFNIRTLNYGTTPVVSSNLGDNAAVAAGNALPPQDNVSGSGTTTALANFLDQDASTARAQTGTPTGAGVGQTGLGATTDAIIRMSGFAYLERGNYDFRVTADDGFRLRVGGETLLEFDGNQPPTTRTYYNVEVSDLISGLTSIELLYWEQGGNANLQFEFKSSDSGAWVPFSLDSIAFFSAAVAPTLTDTRIQDIVETNVNQQYELRTGSVLDGDGNTNTLTGAEGRDYIQGFGGADILNGNGSADFLDGGIGNDVLNGGDGNDILVGGTGSDAMTGGAGDDIYRIDNAGDTATEVAGAGQGTDTVEIDGSYAVGTYVIQANFENALLAGSLNSNVTGNAANNRITGNDGNNILVGSAGDDRLLGGRGNDTLSGDAGPLAGGNVGKDIFEWNLADRATAGAPAIDHITDFTYSGSTTSSAVPSGDLVPQRTDSLDLRDLLGGESSSSLVTGGVPNIGNLLNYIDFSVAGGETSIRISSTGGFTGGTYAAGQEDQRIALTGLDLYAATGVAAGNEAALLQRLLANGTLVVD